MRLGLAPRLLFVAGLAAGAVGSRVAARAGAGQEQVVSLRGDGVGEASRGGVPAAAPEPSLEPGGSATRAAELPRQLLSTPRRLAAAVMPPSMPEPAPLRLAVLTVRLARNQTLTQALARLPLGPGQAQAILSALAGKLPFRKARPGDQLRVERVEGESDIRRFTYRQSAADEWSVTLGPDGEATGEKRTVRLTTQLARVEVPIHGSVWESLERAGEEPALAVLAADALAFDVDFYQEVRAGDRLCLLVEKVLADGKLLRYGDILAVAYQGELSGERSLFRFTDSSGFSGYYDPDGRPARRGFLRSPLRYAHMTSGFGIRVHPILGYVKAHQGVDYGAATGTPVLAVAEGTVKKAGWLGGCGKAVVLSHRNGLESIYCHLSRVSVRPGARVSQKQVVGLVGMTGLATGPHLHYAVRRGGAYVNPASIKVPREAPLTGAQREAFLRAATPLRAELEAEPVAQGDAGDAPRG